MYLRDYHQKKHQTWGLIRGTWWYNGAFFFRIELIIIPKKIRRTGILVGNLLGMATFSPRKPYHQQRWEKNHWDILGLWDEAELPKWDALGSNRSNGQKMSKASDWFRETEATEALPVFSCCMLLSTCGLIWCNPLPIFMRLALVQKVCSVHFRGFMTIPGCFHQQKTRNSILPRFAWLMNIHPSFSLADNKNLAEILRLVYTILKRIDNKPYPVLLLGYIMNNTRLVFLIGLTCQKNNYIATICPYVIIKLCPPPNIHGWKRKLHLLNRIPVKDFPQHVTMEVCPVFKASSGQNKTSASLRLSFRMISANKYG